MMCAVDYVILPPTSATGARDWCSSRRRLQLNENKTELAWFGKRSLLNKLVNIEQTVTVGDSVIQPAAAIRDLGTNCVDSVRYVVLSDRNSSLSWCTCSFFEA